MNRSRMLVLLLSLIALGALSGRSIQPASAAGHRTEPTLYRWHGQEQLVHLPLDAQMVPGAPASFRRFARAQLTATWTTYLHHKPACKAAPDFYVRSLRTDGFALGAAGTHPVPGCQTGGGYEAFWSIRNGQWKQVIGTQDIPRCQRLDKLGFPSELGIHQCYDGINVVTYDHP